MRRCPQLAQAKIDEPISEELVSGLLGLECSMDENVTGLGFLHSSGQKRRLKLLDRQFVAIPN